MDFLSCKSYCSIAAIILVSLCSLIALSESLAQKANKKKEWRPNKNQVDFINSLNWDMTQVRGDQAREAFYYVAYSTSSNNRMAEIFERFELGLKDKRNLPDLIRAVKFNYGDRASLALLSLFPSISSKDRTHLLFINQTELEQLAEKYAKWLESKESDQPRY